MIWPRFYPWWDSGYVLAWVLPLVGQWVCSGLGVTPGGTEGMIWPGCDPWWDGGYVLAWV